MLSQFCIFVWWICPCTHALTGKAPTQHIATSRTSCLKMWSVNNAQVNLVSLFASVAKSIEKDFEAPMSLALGFRGSFGYTGMKKFTGKCWCKTFRGHTCLQPRRRSVEAVASAVGQCTLLRNLHASRSPLAFRLIHGHGFAQHQVAHQLFNRPALHFKTCLTRLHRFSRPYDSTTATR